MEISNVIHQTYEIINKIYWKYFQSNNDIEELTKEQKYTLNTDIEHLEYNLKLIKKYTDENSYKEIIEYFNDMYNKNGLKLKGE